MFLFVTFSTFSSATTISSSSALTASTISFLLLFQIRCLICINLFPSNNDERRLAVESISANDLAHDSLLSAPTISRDSPSLSAPTIAHDSSSLSAANSLIVTRKPIDDDPSLSSSSTTKSSVADDNVDPSDSVQNNNFNSSNDSLCSRIEELWLELNNNACRCFDTPHYDELNMQISFINQSISSSNTLQQDFHQSNRTSTSTSRIWIGCTMNYMPSVYKDLSVLPDDVILSKLWIWNNLIPRMPSRFLAHVKTEKLIIERNHLGEMTRDVLAPTAPYLLHLILRNNIIRQFDVNTFISQLTRLVTLDMGWNLLTELTSTNVNSSGGQLKSHLKFLSFANNRLQRVGGRVFKNFNQLEHLNLASNQIRSLSDRSIFEGLENLRVLNLENNQLETLDELTLMNLPNLHILNLGGNRLTRISLPATVGQLTNQLRQLYLHRNRFDELTEENMQITTNLHNLELLNMDQNQIKSLTWNLGQTFPRLKVLSLAQNRISHLGAACFRRTPNLHIIALQNNQLQTLPDDLFVNCADLSQILLSQNRLSRLGARTFRNLANLTILNLARNRLTQIDPEAMTNLHKLKRLHLNQNLLTHLNIQAITQAAPNLQVINLAANPWSCDCAIMNLSQWLDEHNESAIYLHETVCNPDSDSKNSANPDSSDSDSTISLVPVYEFWRSPIGQQCSSRDLKKKNDSSSWKNDDEVISVEIDSPWITVLALLLGLSTIFILFAVLLLYLQDGERLKKANSSNWQNAAKVNNYLIRRVPSDMVKLIPSAPSPVGN